MIAHDLPLRRRRYGRTEVAGTMEPRGATTTSSRGRSSCGSASSLSGSSLPGDGRERLRSRRPRVHARVHSAEAPENERDVVICARDIGLDRLSPLRRPRCALEPRRNVEAAHDGAHPRPTAMVAQTKCAGALTSAPRSGQYREPSQTLPPLTSRAASDGMPTVGWSPTIPRA
jgi:hypothetical protein